MKIVLVMVAAFGLSVSAAAADCAGHAKVTTTGVDTETTVASVVKQVPPAPVEESAPAEQATQE